MVSMISHIFCLQWLPVPSSLRMLTVVINAACHNIMQAILTTRPNATVTGAQRRPTWTEEGWIAGCVLDGGVSAVKLTQLS